MALTSSPNAPQKGQLLFFAMLALKTLFCVSRQDLRKPKARENKQGTKDNLDYRGGGENTHILLVVQYRRFLSTARRPGMDVRKTMCHNSSSLPHVTLPQILHDDTFAFVCKPILNHL